MRRFARFFFRGGGRGIRPLAELLAGSRRDFQKIHGTPFRTASNRIPIPVSTLDSGPPTALTLPGVDRCRELNYEPPAGHLRSLVVRVVF